MKKRKQILILTAAVLAFSYVLYQGVLMPWRTKQELTQRKIQQYERKLLKDLRGIQESAAFERTYQGVLEEFKQTSPDEQEVSSFLSQIENVAAQLNVRISDLKPQRVKVIDAYKSCSVSVVLDGELPQVMEFIYRLQERPHHFGVEELRMERKSFSSSELKCRLVLSRILVP